MVWMRRIQSEFVEMPGLHLTKVQAHRLWSLDSRLCDTVCLKADTTDTPRAQALPIQNSGSVRLQRDRRRRPSSTQLEREKCDLTVALDLRHDRRVRRSAAVRARRSDTDAIGVRLIA